MAHEQDLLKDRSANGTSVSVGRAWRIIEEQHPGLVGLDAALTRRCRGASFSTLKAGYCRGIADRPSKPLFSRAVQGSSGSRRRLMPALASSTTISQDTSTRPGLKYTSAAFF